MRSVHKTLLIDAPIANVWDALTCPQDIGGWMGDDSVHMDLTAGGGYRLFGGETTGQFTRIEPPCLLEYTWRQSGWPQDWPDSLVQWKLETADSATQVRLTHSQFPNQEERDSHDEGWDVYFLGPMKEWLEGNDRP